MRLIRHILLPTATVILAAAASAAGAQEVVKIGLVAALSGNSALSGEAITRGMSIAIDEINARGGVMNGKKLVLVKRDDESNPGKGQLAARELIEKEKVAIVFGGIDTPVSAALVNVMQELKTPYMGVWAAGTNITHHGKTPNFMFRVSVVDERVDLAMMKYAQKNFGAKKPGAILVNNPWGESNQKGLEKASVEMKLPLAAIEKYGAADVDITPQLTRLRNAGADSLILVGNAAPAAQVMKSLDRMGWKVPVVSHWGISGGRFNELAGPRYKDVHFVQTYSFFGKQSKNGEKVLAELKKRYPEIKGPEDVLAPVGVANSYDAVMLTALALNVAKSTNGDKLREGFYGIPDYDGLIKTYKKPFSNGDNDALTDSDYIWVRFEGKNAVPVK
ncbi:ABC transporter substrate-binding protein [Lacisediminimonas sp.]|uniref:ABC transporter substrate-binding protein n=1 Tax=Lacisediminimonas sp. TaxID=3060582 RepID=UPI002726B539|nr:ABC transporter substrate-binding protein [Lacisediminimonas sp.]MDO8300880.1 ABC transporter substrate-binding protein [Lacisediminimonas sp.]